MAPHMTEDDVQNIDQSTLDAQQITFRIRSFIEDSMRRDDCAREPFKRNVVEYTFELLTGCKCKIKRFDAGEFVCIAPPPAKEMILPDNLIRGEVELRRVLGLQPPEEIPQFAGDIKIPLEQAMSRMQYLPNIKIKDVEEVRRFLKHTEKHIEESVFDTSRGARR